MMIPIDSPILKRGIETRNRRMSMRGASNWMTFQKIWLRSQRIGNTTLALISWPDWSCILWCSSMARKEFPQVFPRCWVPNNPRMAQMFRFIWLFPPVSGTGASIWDMQYLGMWKYHDQKKLGFKLLGLKLGRFIKFHSDSREFRTFSQPTSISILSIPFSEYSSMKSSMTCCDMLWPNMTKVEVAGSLRLGGGPLHAITWTEMIYFLRCLARKIQKPMHGQMAPARCVEVGWSWFGEDPMAGETPMDYGTSCLRTFVLPSRIAGKEFEWV